MKRLSFCSVLALAAALSGYSTMREAPHRGGQPQQDISNPEEANNDMTRSADANADADNKTPGVIDVRSSAQGTTRDAQLASLPEESWSVDWEHMPVNAPERLPYLLAARFNYDVKQGGFAQLLYNMRGQCLAEIEDMLILAGAKLAQDHYVRAIHVCLQDKAEYQRFLASTFTDANAVKSDLQLISIEHLQAGGLSGRGFRVLVARA